LAILTITVASSYVEELITTTQLLRDLPTTSFHRRPQRVREQQDYNWNSQHLATRFPLCLILA